jgi:hypothetical protein
VRISFSDNILHHGVSKSKYTRNEDILENLTADEVEKKLAQYKEKCLNHFSRMEDTRSLVSRISL